MSYSSKYRCKRCGWVFRSSMKNPYCPNCTTNHSTFDMGRSTEDDDDSFITRVESSHEETFSGGGGEYGGGGSSDSYDSPSGGSDD